eukprot:sb/3478828/
MFSKTQKLVIIITLERSLLDKPGLPSIILNSKRTPDKHFKWALNWVTISNCQLRGWGEQFATDPVVCPSFGTVLKNCWRTLLAPRHAHRDKAALFKKN